MAKWPEIITLWAFVADGRHRDRILTKHSLFMKVVERSSLEAFRDALDDPQADWRLHLSAGIGYDLERLEREVRTVLGQSEGPKPDELPGVRRLHDDALVALGAARRTVRERKDRDTPRVNCEILLRAAEKLYDSIEEQLDDADRKDFIEDGLAKTEAWLATNEDHDGNIGAQRSRLLDAKSRLKDGSAGGER